MKSKKQIIIASIFAVTQTNSIAVLRMDPDPDLESDIETPDWLMYLILMGVVLIMFGKEK